MNRYAPPGHRPLFALGAIALTAATMGLAVVPAAQAPQGAPALPVAAARAATPIEVVIVPGRIEVLGVRDDSLAASPARGATRRTSSRS